MFDLAIAVAVLMASENKSFPRMVFVGELAMNAIVRPVRGTLPALLGVKDMPGAIVPWGNGNEAACVQHMEVRVAAHLYEVIEYLQGTRKPTHAEPCRTLPRARGEGAARGTHHCRPGRQRCRARAPGRGGDCLGPASGGVTMRPSDHNGKTTLLARCLPLPTAASSALASRAWRRTVSAFWSFVDSFRDPRVADFLPPVPEQALLRGDGTSAAERGERLLLEVLCAPREYLSGLAAVAASAERWHERGSTALEVELVHVALSRMQPDRHGEIPLVWLEDKLKGVACVDLPRALRRLAHEDAIELLPAREGDVGPRVDDELRGLLGRVKLQGPL
jgi:hypothetical protein